MEDAFIQMELENLVQGMLETLQAIKPIREETVQKMYSTVEMKRLQNVESQTFHKICRTFSINYFTLLYSCSRSQEDDLV